MKQLPLLILAAALQSPTAEREDLARELFQSEAQALAFGVSIGPLFGTPKERREYPSSDGPPMIRYLFEAGEKVAALDVRSDRSGHIWELELGFPVIDSKCHGAPPSHELARLAIMGSEPNLVRNPRNVALVQGAAELGWPRANSSLSAQLGNTVYAFHRSRYYCTMAIRRLPVTTRTI